MTISKYNVEEHLNSLPSSCNYITEEIKYSAWNNAVENNILPEDSLEEDYDYEIVCVIREREHNVERAV